ncbi:MAG: hypothetical protein QXW00_03245 [Candidatus Woesearchaeota archaeon]
MKEKNSKEFKKPRCKLSGKWWIIAIAALIVVLAIVLIISGNNIERAGEAFNNISRNWTPRIPRRAV